MEIVGPVEAIMLDIARVMGWRGGVTLTHLF